MRIRVWAGIVFLVLAHFFLHLGFELGRSAPDLLTLALLIGAREVRLGGGVSSSGSWRTPTRFWASGPTSSP